MNIVNCFTDLIGHTPLVALSHYSKNHCPRVTLLAKLESFNPAGSAKDRVAAAMIAEAEAQGKLHPGSVIVEPTSGNTGIGLAAVAAAKGYKVILTMPDTMSIERRKLLTAYGAEIVLTEGSLGMNGAIDRAKAIVAATEGAFFAGQFENPANPYAHYTTTGPEIWEDTDGSVDLFVAGVGTGGTLSGVGRCLKERNSNIRIIAVEPTSSPLISQGKAGPHGLQGIGANFLPENFDPTVCDEVLTVSEEEAYAAARALAREEGYLVGITSGAALHAATVMGNRPAYAGKTIVALLPDTGDRYLSTPLFDND